MMPKKKVAIIFPAFLFGGAEKVAAWMIEALKINYDVTLFTFSTIDCDELNKLYGTQLKPQEFVVIIPYKGTIIHKALTSRYENFTARQHLIEYFYKAVKGQYDLAISAFNEMDLGKRGIQYLHSPMFGPEHEKGRILLEYPDSPLRRIYHRIFEAISGFSTKRMKKNISVSNSIWTAKLIQDLYKIEVGILYPPVTLEAPDVPWMERENGFICISRIVPEKKIENVIETLQKVREKGFNVHLHVISSSNAPEYRKKILDLQEKHADWVFISENLYNQEIAKILAQHRYGLHMRENEQFGIAIAEMVQGGCIPFVPSSGAPGEIIGNIPALKFQTDDEAVEKICTVLSNPKLQTELQLQLSARKNIFTPEKFCISLVSLVNKALEDI